ncbi:heat-inducible transcriptional repressor HrcA [Oceanirhabdus seepicola]|uniref:Heat-inducible transcription repressor HrcA n=1 Tax=Oceanirhabdus seepicola TaxID=2828781 RepID=A0A9J6P332_9CLOT|nr:heat-inducible transcriptional repressor HrcA [Oceanirhabdus seepicola]MCM1990780.1 heat-inducible transcriptional repressor HrcA [Oceanirhabdus seepicola]
MVSANKEVVNVLSERKLKILEAIIKDYIETGEPVGSRTLAKKYNIGISSATIRNEMADLEEMGYLEHLHSSSGRIPSDKGYRLYVDKLMSIQRLPVEEEMMIKNRMLSSAIYEVDRLVKEATIVLSKITKLATIVKAPSVRKSFIKRVQILQIDEQNVLMVFVTDSGLIRNNVISVTDYIDEKIIEKINRILNLRLVGLTIDDIDLEVINNLQNDLVDYEEIFKALIPALYKSLKSIEPSKVYTEGYSNILDYPQFQDVDRAKDFLNLLSDEESLKELIKSPEVGDNNLSITIGTENYIESVKECTIITANYKIGGRDLGSIGVVGPRRMNYEKVIATLNEIVNELNINIKTSYNRESSDDYDNE